VSTLDPELSCPCCC